MSDECETKYRLQAGSYAEIKSPGGWPGLRCARTAQGLFLQDHEVDPTIFRHGGIVAIRGGFKTAFGKGFRFVGSDANRGEVMLGRSGTTIAQAQIVFRRAAPVAMAFEEQPVLGMLFEVFRALLKLGALALP